MKNGSGGKFRKKQVNFSMVSNNIIRNDNVSLKGKGLFALIQSYITLDGFTLYKGFLRSKCIEGERAFDSAWRELKEKGYLIQYKLKDENNKYYYEYELVDEPFPYPQNVGMDIKPPQHFAGVQNEKVQFKELQNVADNNTLQSNDLQNNIVPNHIYVTETEIMEQIGYNPQMKDDFTENLVMLMVDVLNTSDDSLIRVNQENLKASVVKQRFKKIQYKHIQYVKLVFEDFTGQISSIRSYLITALYNSVATCDIYFTNRVNHDLHKENAPTG